MSDNILSKKIRILGEQPSQADAMSAIQSGQWNARDASEYRKATEAPSAQKRLSHAELAAKTMRR